MPEQLPISVWPVAQAPSQVQRKERYVPASMAHPGKMLPEIARRAIDAYTRPGDYVVDPMCGIGTSLVEAAHLGRNAIGVEHEQRWVDLARDNIALAHAQGATGDAAAHSGDGRQVADLVDPEVVGKVALVLTSPPYGPSLHGHVQSGDGPVRKTNHHYSSDRANLEYASTEDLFGAFGEILAACATLLRPGGIVAITTRPWRRDGILVDLPGAVIRLGASVGLEPFERNVALLCGLRDDRLVGRPSFFQLDNTRKARAKGVPLAIISHEDVIVMRRPVPGR